MPRRWPALRLTRSASLLPSTVLVMRLEDVLSIAVEQALAAYEPLSGFGRQLGAVEVELADFLEPDLQLLQVDVVFLKLGIGEVLRGGFLGDLRLEIVALIDQLAVGLVAIRLEAADDLFFLAAIERDGFQDDRVAADFSDIVFQHLEPAGMVVGLRQ